MTRRPLAERFVAFLALASSDGSVLTMGGGSFCPRGSTPGVMEQQRCQGVSQMPFDMIGEHAQEDVGAHPRCGPMADRADIEIDGLQAAEGTLDAGQVLVGLHRFIRIELLGRHGCADHVDAVETGLLFYLLRPALEGEVAVADLHGEVLGHLPTVHHATDRQADLSGTAQRRVPAADLRLDAEQLAFGGGQQFLALAPTLAGEFAVATDDEPFAGEHLGRADLGQVALVEQ